MRVLVIGGSGFLSGTVARVAQAAGHDVTIVTRGRRALPTGLRAIVADRDVPDAFAAAVAAAAGRWDVVVDCIGFKAEHARQDLDCFVGRCGHLVFVSTDSVFEPFHRPWRIDETFEHYDAHSAYGRGKREAELALLGGADAGLARGTAVTILRPCHIYGPGSLLGCLPEHGRDPQLLDRIRAGEPLRLVGGGHFLQQPIFAADLAAIALSCVGNARVAGQVYLTPGQEVVASRDFYTLIADALGVEMPPITEVPIDAFVAANPGKRHFCCHRVYATDKARRDGLTMPTTPLRDGLAAHVRSIVAAGGA